MSSSTSTPAAVPPPSTAETKPRKFPLPCWTHEETLALIDAYRERWLSLRRGYLRTVDWEAVASTVASKYEHVSPTKSSDQCRHKIEKLRQRFRAEKQRSVAAFPGKFVSGWIFYKGLSFLDDGVESKKRGSEEKDGNVDQVADVSNGDSDEGFFLTALGDRKFTIDLKNFVKTQNPNFGIRRNIPASGFRKFARTEMPNHNFSGDEVHEKLHLHRGFVRSDIVETPARYPIAHNAKIVRNNYGNNDNSIKEDLGRGKDPLAEMAESIKQMGEGFLKMEKLRMEMTLEFEKARMEMELKRNEMIVASHKRMVETFVNSVETNKLKK